MELINQWANTTIAVAVLLWLGKYILMPLREAHVEFLKKTTSAIEAQGYTLTSVKDAMVEVKNTIVEIGGARKAETERLDHIAEQLERVVTGIAEAQTVVVQTREVVIQRLPPYIPPPK